MKKLLMFIVAGVFAVSMGHMTLHAAVYNVKQASSSNSNVTAGQISAGPVTVTDVFISSRGVASNLYLFNLAGSTSTASQLLGFDTTAPRKFEDLNVGFPGGLTIDAAGSSTARWTIVYKFGSSGFDVNKSSYSDDAASDENLKNGAGILERIIVGDNLTSATGIQVFNSAGGSDSTDVNNQLANVEGDSVIDHAFSVNFSSGLTVTRTGAVSIMVIYK